VNTIIHLDSYKAELKDNWVGDAMVTDEYSPYQGDLDDGLFAISLYPGADLLVDPLST